jgi:hypothetical protein
VVPAAQRLIGRAGGNLGPFKTMKATFNGVPGEEHDSLYMYGQVFPKGKAVSVSSPLGARKLANHPHFTTSAEPKDEVEDAEIKREFTAAAAAALAEKEAAAPAPTPAPEPAPTPAPTPAPEPLKSALDYQARYESVPAAAAGHMPETVKSAAEYQELELKGGIHGNADAGTAGDADSSQDQGVRPAGRGGRGRSGRSS